MMNKVFNKIATGDKMSQFTKSAATQVGYLCLLACALTTVTCYPHQQHYRMLAARRAADDSRPISRVHMQPSESRQDVEPSIVTGKFKAPAPERMFTARIPKTSNFGTHTVGASYRVADDVGDSTSASQADKIVHGIVGSSLSNNKQGQKIQSIQRTVGAKFQVSDEGLDYPPSKLSADIYGNVAEIVTAPPEAVENDFLIPQSSRFSSQTNGNRRRLNN